MQVDFEVIEKEVLKVLRCWW